MENEVEIIFRTVFMNNYITRRDEVRDRDLRFVHYTTAENALKILKSEEFWLRRSSVMNDYSEIQHGENCVVNALKIHSEKINNILDELKPGLAKKIGVLVDNLIDKAKQETFIASFAEHDTTQGSHENEFGRLSMWRAYGGSTGAALVLRRESFFAESEPGSKLMTSPVNYSTVDEFAPEFLRMFERVEAQKAELQKLGDDLLVQWFSFSILFAVLSTKHRGFEEEKEWRLIYCPAIGQSSHVKITNETINGTPQRVCRFPLKNSAELNIDGVDIDQILERIIVGPCKFPMDAYDAFIAQLEESKIEEAYKRLHISFIPIRS
jgi:Protein of unknown function (DUF2971)